MDLFPALARAVCSDRALHGAPALRQSLWLSLRIARDSRRPAPRRPVAVMPASEIDVRTRAAIPAIRRAIAMTRARDDGTGPEAA